MKYNVCLVRKYTDRSSNKEKQHFWQVGKAFSFEGTNGTQGINIKLYSRTLMTDEFVLFEDTEENRESKDSHPPPHSDDIPF